MQVLQRRYPVEASNWTSVDQLFGLRDELNRWLERDLSPWSRSTEFYNGWVPALDLAEDKEGFIVKVELPGMKKEDIQIEMHDGALNITGERKTPESKEDTETYRSERFYGRFHRTVALPKPVALEKVNASYKDGILSVNLPKAEEAKPRQIEVSMA